MIRDTAQDPASLGWTGILRLGLVQAALGAVVVLVTSTLNRVMVVEYALPALLPGMLVALHYAVQIVRPRFGHGSDRGGRRTPWIIGGMAALALGGVLCALAAVSLRRFPTAALLLAIGAYSLVGLGVGAAGTSLLALMARRVDDRRRAPAATIMWVLMIAGFAVTSITAGHFLDPYSPQRLVLVTAVVGLIALSVAAAAVFGLDRGGVVGAGTAGGGARAGVDFATALRSVWSEPEARNFTMFVFVSMLAYSAQELLLEPFCGVVFGYTVGESARLSGLWHAAVLIGMVCVGVACGGARRFGSLRAWTIGGCCASAAAISSLACAGIVGPAWPLRASAVLLGLSNGVFAVAAIGSMMELAHRGEANGAGVRMGLWGASQAVAFACGGVLGTGIVDLVGHVVQAPVVAYVTVFGVEAALFLVAARFAFRVSAQARRDSNSELTAVAA